MSVFPSRFLPLTDFISQHAEWHPEKAAVVFEGETRTWREFNIKINWVANGLATRGISRGDRVAIVSRNCLEYAEIMFGILKAGGIVVPISAMLKKETVLLELQNSEPKAIFVGYSCLPQVEECLSLISENNRIVISEQVPGWISYPDFCSGSSGAGPNVIIEAEDLFNIIYSSGTTGQPKGIVHTHQARLRFAMTCSLEFRVHNETVSLISTPLYSNGTLLIYLPTILLGGTLAILRSFDPVSFFELLQKERCTHAFLVPTQFIRIMEHPEFHRYDASSMELLLSAAAPLWKKTKCDILNKFSKSKLVELYGLTEGVSTVLRPNEQFLKLGSVGKPRLGGDIKIIDDKGNELPRGEIGEIVGYNFSMMKGYYQNAAMTEKVMWRSQEDKLYLKTGDIGKLDSEGYLYILDRKKDMIVSGGVNIFPSDIEDVILKHPDIAEAAVIGVPHEEWGESPLALIVKRNQDSPVSENELRDWVNGKLAGYQKLMAVEFKPSLLKNDLGKVLKSELRKPYWQGFKT